MLVSAGKTPSLPSRPLRRLFVLGDKDRMATKLIDWLTYCFDFRPFKSWLGAFGQEMLWKWPDEELFGKSSFFFWEDLWNIMNFYAMPHRPITVRQWHTPSICLGINISPGLSTGQLSIFTAINQYQCVCVLSGHFNRLLLCEVRSAVPHIQNQGRFHCIFSTTKGDPTISSPTRTRRW